MPDVRDDNDCNHEWVYDGALLLSFPAVYKRICKKCGKMESGSGWGESDNYSEVVKKFHPEEKP